MTSDSEQQQQQMERVVEAVRASIANQKRIIELLTAQSEHISQTIERQNDIVSSQTAVIESQHESIARFQNDLLLKTQKDLIMELIGIADNIQAMLAEQKRQPDAGKLLKDVQDLAAWVDKSLETAAVRSFSDVETRPEIFNPERQEMQPSVATDQPEENGRLVSIQRGYIWSMPWLIVNSEVQLQNIVRDNPEARTFQFVLRPELIAKKKYITPTNQTEE